MVHQVKDQHCNFCSLGYSCAVGLIPGVGTSASHGCGQKKINENMKKNISSKDLSYGKIIALNYTLIQCFLQLYLIWEETVSFIGIPSGKLNLGFAYMP